MVQNQSNITKVHRQQLLFCLTLWHAVGGDSHNHDWVMARVEPLGVKIYRQYFMNSPPQMDCSKRPITSKSSYLMTSIYSEWLFEEYIFCHKLQHTTFILLTMLYHRNNTN